MKSNQDFAQRAKFSILTSLSSLGEGKRCFKCKML